MAYIRQAIRKAVSALVIDNPPINVLSSVVVGDLCNKLKILEDHKETEVIVLMGKNDCFSAGADFREFDRFRIGQKESTPELSNFVEKLENCQKPVVAYLRRFAFGGGLELALGCHYRVAHEDTKLGLPEVKIGLIPGAQGTQRLPRLIDMERALKMIAYGRHIYPQEAHTLGLIDKIVSTDGAMFDFAVSVAGKPYEDRKISHKSIKISSDADPDTIIHDYRSTLQLKSKGMDAPLLGVDAVAGALKSASFHDGMKIESQLFNQAMNSGQSRSLRYIFQAERKAAKLSPTLMNVVPKQVERIAIVGGGLMGTGIATAFLTRGFPVLLIEKDPQLADKSVQRVAQLSQISAELGRAKVPDITVVSTKEWLHGEPGLCGAYMIEPGQSQTESDKFFMQALQRVDLVIEAVNEDLQLKQKILQQLDKVCRPGTFICSNTSTIDIDKLAEVTKRPRRVAALHFFNPAYHISIVEIARGTHTGPALLSTMHSVCRRLSKVPVITGNCFGFCGNRMLIPYLSEAMLLLLENEGKLDPFTIDEVMEEHFGMRLGPFRMMDLIGLDLIKDIQIVADATFGELNPLGDKKIKEVMNVLTKEGRLGRKAGLGWYRYDTPGGKHDESDPKLLELIAPIRNSKHTEPPPAPTSAEQMDMVERCVYGLINEGFNILDEGIVDNPESIDTIWVKAYGWPKSRGGPIFYSRTVGFSHIYQKIKQFGEHLGNHRHWQTSSLLEKLSHDGSLLDHWKPPHREH